MLPVLGQPELGIAKVCRGIAAIRKWPCRMGTKERPDIEVLDPVLAVQAVQGGTLAQGHREQTVSVKPSRFWMAAKQGG